MQNKLFILMSTIDNRILNLKNIIQLHSEQITYVVSHQVTETLEEESKNYIDVLTQRDDVIYDILESKGVAKNRNNTLRFVESESICLILDDDVLLCDNVFKNVLKSFSENPKSDFISFKILDLDGHDYKYYSAEKKQHTFCTLKGIGTTEMAFRRDLLTEQNIVFDERFGPGADKYPMGEDFIFAMDFYASKANMLFVPVPIVKHPRVSTGSRVDKKVIFARGAVFARVYGRWAYVLNIYFSLKHKKMYKDSFTLLSYLKLMTTGSYDYLNRKKDDE